jgi:deoxyribonuclease V
LRLALHHEHPWDLTPKEAVAFQRELAARVREEPLPAPPRTVAGVDMSVKDHAVRAAVAVLSFPALEVIDRAVWEGPVEFPYVPGLLSFREIPAVLRSLERLSALPDLIMADAQGRAHPRRIGMASHLGVLLDHPVIGVAKSRLTGTYAEPGPERGASSPLLDKEEQIGVVLRTRPGVSPLFVSVGHRVTLDDAVRLTLACATRFRLPEPARRAHRLSRGEGAGGDLV